jgi:hypothetical protein
MRSTLVGICEGVGVFLFILGTLIFLLGASESVRAPLVEESAVAFYTAWWLRWAFTKGKQP